MYLITYHMAQLTHLRFSANTLNTNFICLYPPSVSMRFYLEVRKRSCHVHLS